MGVTSASRRTLWLAAIDYAAWVYLISFLVVVLCRFLYKLVVTWRASRHGSDRPGEKGNAFLLWWRSPALRLGTALLIMIMNFHMYMNDPMAFANTYSPFPGFTWMTEQQFYLLIQIGVELLDILTFWMILDMMLQDTSHFPDWWPSARAAWARPNVRLRMTYTVPLLFWIGTCVVLLKGTTNEGAVGWKFNEGGRIAWASTVFMCDVLIVCQDWEFPTFDNPMDIKMLGTNWQTLSACSFTIPGKLVNFGPMFIVMMMDAYNVYCQFNYGFIDAPMNYGQYLERSGRIWAVQNSSIAQFIRTEWEANSSAWDPLLSKSDDCAIAIPYDLGVPMSGSPPCFGGDIRLRGVVQKQGLSDGIAGMIPMFFGIFLLFAVRRCVLGNEIEKGRRATVRASMIAQQETAYAMGRSVLEIELGHRS